MQLEFSYQFFLVDPAPGFLLSLAAMVSFFRVALLAVFDKISLCQSSARRLENMLVWSGPGEADIHGDLIVVGVEFMLGSPTTLLASTSHELL